MYAATSLSEPAQQAPALYDVRVAGGVDIRAETAGGSTRVTRVRERDGYKARFARRADPPEAIIINTGGGLASGDAVHQAFEIDDAAALTVTTQAAERCYRSGDGATTTLTVEAEVGAGATFNWLPQETILFDNARLARSMTFSLAPGARLLMAETLVLGRRAMGERLRNGLFTDRWRVHRDGKLIFAENVRLGDDVFDIMSSPAIADGAHAILTLLLAEPDAGDRLTAARAVLDDAPFACAASAWDDKLVVRGLAAKSEHIHQLLHALVPALGGPPLPRAWST